MVTDEETLPFDIRMVTPGTPEYAEGEKIHRAAQRNLDFYREYESELMERFPGPCILLVYNGCEAKAFSDNNELDQLLETLGKIERSAALEFPVPEPGVAWIL